MLVLTRKVMETLLIGDEIAITVVRLERGQVRLGIVAPSHVPVIRAELKGTDREARLGLPGQESRDSASRKR